MNLKDKVVWVTGASSGIGEATAYALAKEGCKLVLSARRKSELERVKSNCLTDASNVFILPIDLEHYTEADDWAQKVMGKFSHIDVLINNGGISQDGLALETTLEVERKIMDINYFGNVAISKAVAKIMKQQQRGKLVVITSILGKFGLPKLSTYAASKHALYGFYDSFRLELDKNNIDLLLVAPGFINTNVTLNAVTADGSRLNKNSPAQANGMPAEEFAKKLLRAIKSNRTHKYIGKKELLSIPFKTLFPKLFYKIMLKMSAKKE